MRYLTHVGRHIRALAGELRPLVLDDFGLDDSLRSLADGLASESVRIELDLPTVIPRLTEAMEVGIFRMAQDALLNAVRHARASSVTVSLASTDGSRWNRRHSTARRSASIVGSSRA